MTKTYKTGEAQRAAANRYYAENREERLAYAAEYRARNAEKLREYFSSEEARQRKNARRRAWNEANRERQRAVNEAHHLKRYHGLTVEQYRAMAIEQGGKCAICAEEPQGKKHCAKLHVDHNHGTGAIRALLCAHCNRGIGLFRERPELLRLAAAYLERFAAADIHPA